MAYVDGELDEAESAMVRNAIAQSDELRAREQRFKKTAVLAREAYDELMREPVPAKIMDIFDGQVHVLPVRPPVSVQGRPALALAASLGLAVGIGLALIGVNMGGSVQLAEVGPEGLAATGALALALEKNASRSALRVSSSTVIEPTVTFPRKGGGWCREYRVSNGAAAAAGLACRDDNGIWRVQAHLPAMPAPSGAGNVVPSGDPSLLDSTADSLTGGNPLSLREEQDLMAAGWPTK
jgi:hypothetical protein